MRLLHIVGARPNFVKAAPVMRAACEAGGVWQGLVHTGQHSDPAMSEVFIDELAMPEPDVRLHVASGSHAEQTGRMMVALDPVLGDLNPDWIVVYGDVTSTLAGALSASALGIPVAHVEAGLRSGDRAMPEEINRIVTDHVSDLCFTPHEAASVQLAAEGITGSRVHCAGNVMVDSLLTAMPKSRSSDCWRVLGLPDKGFVLVTLHRPQNVDKPEVLGGLLRAVATVAMSMPVVFPVHPRTRSQITANHFEHLLGEVHVVDPIGYLEMISLVDHSAVVLTDSGGLQVETTALGVPCVTVRDTTEWPETITLGTNRLVSSERDAVVAAVRDAHSDAPAARREFSLKGWDGQAAKRIVSAILETHLSCGAGPRLRRS